MTTTQNSCCPTHAVIPALALPGGVTVSATGLVCERELALDEWKSIGAKLTRVGTTVAWAVGDWWNLGLEGYGAKKAAAAALKAMGRGFALQTCKNLGWIARHVEKSRRRDLLSFGHHAEVASRSPEEQSRYLDAAVQNKWSVMRLRKQLRDDDIARFRIEPDGDISAADQRAAEYFRRLIVAAQIPDVFCALSRPYESSYVKDFLVRNQGRNARDFPNLGSTLERNGIRRSGDVARHFEKTAEFWATMAAYMRRVAAEVRAAHEAARAASADSDGYELAAPVATRAARELVVQGVAP